MVLSPITKRTALLEREVSKEWIINRYYSNFRIDTSKLLQNASCIKLYRCAETGYRFFYPFYLSGDSEFYEHLQRNDWYYMPWKWEHDQANSLLKPGMKVLEVGCGKGEFLNKVQAHKDIEVIGLEINQNAVRIAHNTGLSVLIEDIEDHSVKHPNTYDVVCSFQVLEHISDVDKFLNSQINSLKPGGKLIISVPNNDSFIKHVNGGILNFPPHHMGWWSDSALKELEKYFQIKLNKILYEPLQIYHFDWFKSIWIKKYLKNRLLKGLYHYLKLSLLFDLVLRSQAKRIKGHSVLAVFEKI